jgi:hypothetical protein
MDEFVAIPGQALRKLLMEWGDGKDLTVDQAKQAIDLAEKVAPAVHEVLVYMAGRVHRCA